jgi:hypothetical protein
MEEMVRSKLAILGLGGFVVDRESLWRKVSPKEPCSESSLANDNSVTFRHHHKLGSCGEGSEAFGAGQLNILHWKTRPVVTYREMLNVRMSGLASFIGQCGSITTLPMALSKQPPPVNKQSGEPRSPNHHA